MSSTPERVVLATEDDPLTLEHGRRLDHVEATYETWGELAPARDNVVFIAHALTGDAHAAGPGGWWENLIGPGRAIDTDRFHVVCPNLLGGCRGTTGPSSPDPATGAPYGLDFPLLTVRDLVAVHRRLLRHLGVDRLHAAIGGSLGGMQVLQWAIDDPAAIERAVVVAASSRLSAQNIAFSAVARDAILRDPDFHDGRYAERGVRPDRGLAVARRMAHITYVSEESLEAKFGRERLADGPPRHGTDFQVEAYLDHQASVFLERFDALSYLYLTRVMDYFDPFADPAAAARAGSGGTRFLVVSFDTDWRFPTAHSRRIHEHLAAAGTPSEHVELRSPWGHDSFLLQPAGYHDLVGAFLSR
ncbi:homoserine O-acetyltransferase MetX [Nocardioides lianchengensis]|uniref:Homoserine O-succinyltransferase n=1 Tax=Nocardioides lianchengensis TaxID=1045774 RepID=A0A1G6Q8Z8_9ACTN|nr:homoserine O-acetyltransferase [Nocardioides lianchengensis]NYG12142.1 homoserine O-acetyltransferase [Nocardioides lianchengensis]SDC88960.1 homoserine O-acetyltransferase [Nocardioides lianchengensis]